MKLMLAFLMLGFGIGFNVAGLVYWLLWRKTVGRIREELQAVKVEHARIERDLLLTVHEARGTALPPELRQ